MPTDWRPGVKLVDPVVDNTGTNKKKEEPSKAAVEESMSTEESLAKEPNLSQNYFQK